MREFAAGEVAVLEQINVPESAADHRRAILDLWRAFIAIAEQRDPEATADLSDDPNATASLLDAAREIAAAEESMDYQTWQFLQSEGCRRTVLPSEASAEPTTGTSTPTPTLTLTPTLTPTPTITPTPASTATQEGLDGPDLLPEHPWAANLEPGSYEYQAVQDLRDIAGSHPDAFAIIREFAMLAGGITNSERTAIDIMRQCIEGFPAGDPDLLHALSQTWWRQRQVVVYDEVVAPLAIAHGAGCQQAFLDALQQRPSWTAPQDPTPTPTPRPRPTLGPLVPVADLPWTRDGLTALEQRALAVLETFEEQYPEMAEYVLRYAWVHDGITEDEQRALLHLLYVARGGRSTLDPPLSDEDYRQVVNSMRRHDYLMDGISQADLEHLDFATEQFEQSLMVLIFVRGR